MNALIVAEHRAGELNPATLELISAGREFGPVTVALLGPTAPATVDALDVTGVAEILLVNSEVEELDPDVYRHVLSELIAAHQPTLTLVASTPHSFAYAPAVALRSELGFASDVLGIRIDGHSIVAIRSFYGGKVHAEVEFPDRSGVLLALRPAVWEPASGMAAGARRTPVAVDFAGTRVQRVEFTQERSDGVDITKADLILAVGRGIGEHENLSFFEELARKIGATLAASRPLVDAGWVTPNRLVGQSGKTVKPSVYLAFGISGASQHLAGMRASDTIVAVNSDPNAAIFTVADYGGIFDAVELAEELEKVYDSA